MNDIQRILRINIKKYRSGLNYSQFDLSDLCDVSTSYISEIETGKKFPSAKTLQKIVEALEVRPYKLFLDTNDIDNFNKENFLSNFKDHIVSDVETLYSKFTNKDDNQK